MTSSTGTHYPTLCLKGADMPAENHVTITGRLVFEPNEPKGRGPSSIRIASYCSGSGDNRRTAFVGVKSFDHETIASLHKGDIVTVEGRFDPWLRDPDDHKSQVLDVMADDNGVTLADDDRGQARQRSKAAHPHSGRRQAAPEPEYDYDDSEAF